MVSYLLATALTLYPASGSVPIDGDYPRGVTFVARFRAVDTVAVQGAVPKPIRARTSVEDGAVRIWHDGPDGRYRVSGAHGAYVESSGGAFGPRTSARRVLDAVSEFDALGYPKARRADAADLIPIFPGRPVRLGDSWSPAAAVTSNYGNGTARYDYRITKVVRTSDAHVLATFSVAVAAVLDPPKSFRGWTSHLRGNGSITWDCTEHQRRFSQTELTYELSGPGGSVRDTQRERVTLHRIR